MSCCRSPHVSAVALPTVPASINLALAEHSFSSLRLGLNRRYPEPRAALATKLADVLWTKKNGWTITASHFYAQIKYPYQWLRLNRAACTPENMAHSKTAKIFPFSTSTGKQAWASTGSKYEPRLNPSIFQ
ncbi:hypothetical protein DO72_4507 [Burkholderia pseudomallei]|nr:hypothetical protein DO72_4507 [Burkholderia pseudomallei]